MAVKKIEHVESQNVKDMARKFALAYVGAFGVVADELGKLFEMFVARGERMEKDARKMVKQNDKQVRQFAHEMDKERRTAVAKVNKSAKKTVKKVEQALA